MAFQDRSSRNKSHSAPGGFSKGKPFGDKKFGKGKFEKKRSFASKGAKSEVSEGFRGEKKVWIDKPRNDKPRFEKSRSDKPRFDKQRPTTRKPIDKKNSDVAAAAIVQRPDTVLIWGLHAARAVWLNPKRRCYRLWLTTAGKEAFAKTMEDAADDVMLKRPDAKVMERHDLDRLVPPNSVHQGIVIETMPLPEPNLSDLISGDNPPDLLLLLDQVTDPHNVGAILRSASAFGAGAVIMTERNAPSTTGVLAKSASGAVEYVPQIHVVNLARAIDELRQAGYWCVGLAEEGERNLGDLDLTARTVLVLGAEGDGLRQLTRKKCDELARLPTGGSVGSLNVSNAAAVGLYEVRRQKKINKI